MKILKIEYEKRKENEPVYDLEVDGNHNYFVEDVLVSNCHKAKDKNILTKLISKIKTPNKFGFTGTLPKEEEDKWKIIGTFGPVIYEKKSKELRDEGYLTNAHIKIIKLNHNLRKNFSYKNEVEYLHNHEGRNSIIMDIVSKLNKNVLILVNRIEHGVNLREEFYRSDSNRYDKKQCWFIQGETPVEERQQIVNLMEKTDQQVVIAMSSIFSTGVDIKNLHYIIFVDGGKAFIRTIQAIGRGLRLHESKSKLILFDIYDDLKYSSSHIDERKKFYIDEQIPFSEVEMDLN